MLALYSLGGMGGQANFGNISVLKAPVVETPSIGIMTVGISRPCLEPIMPRLSAEPDPSSIDHCLGSNSGSEEIRRGKLVYQHWSGMNWPEPCYEP